MLGSMLVFWAYSAEIWHTQQFLGFPVSFRGISFCDGTKGLGEILLPYWQMLNFKIIWQDDIHCRKQNISHLEKRKIIFKSVLGGDMFVSGGVFIPFTSCFVADSDIVIPPKQKSTSVKHATRKRMSIYKMLLNKFYIFHQIPKWSPKLWYIDGSWSCFLLRLFLDGSWSPNYDITTIPSLWDSLSHKHPQTIPCTRDWKIYLRTNI